MPRCELLPVPVRVGVLRLVEDEVLVAVMVSMPVIDMLLVPVLEDVLVLVLVEDEVLVAVMVSMPVIDMLLVPV